MRILVVSEDPSERSRAVSALALIDDAEVDEATTASEASTRVRGADYDMMVVDGDLASKGGFSWLYELHLAADLDGRTVPPAIVLTSRPQDAWLADWARAEDVLRKPVDSFALVARVRTLTEPAPAGA
jgi:DNA-binding response OmpR family regulator